MTKKEKKIPNEKASKLQKILNYLKEQQISVVYGKITAGKLIIMEE